MIMIMIMIMKIFYEHNENDEENEVFFIIFFQEAPQAAIAGTLGTVVAFA